MEKERNDDFCIDAFVWQNSVQRFCVVRRMSDIDARQEPWRGEDAGVQATTHLNERPLNAQKRFHAINLRQNLLSDAHTVRDEALQAQSFI